MSRQTPITKWPKVQNEGATDEGMFSAEEFNDLYTYILGLPTDVQINGTSLKDADTGIVAIPFATDSAPGIISSAFYRHLSAMYEDYSDHDWVDASSLATVATSGSYNDLYNRPVLGSAASRNVGQANGVAELDATGKVPSSQLPSYVDDVVEFNSVVEHLPTSLTYYHKYIYDGIEVRDSDTVVNTDINVAGASLHVDRMKLIDITYGDPRTGKLSAWSTTSPSTIYYYYPAQHTWTTNSSYAQPLTIEYISIPQVGNIYYPTASTIVSGVTVPANKFYMVDIHQAHGEYELVYTEAFDREGGKIYVATDTNKSYRWSGTTLVEITSGGVIVDSQLSPTSVNPVQNKAIVAVLDKKADLTGGKVPSSQLPAMFAVIKDDEGHELKPADTAVVVVKGMGCVSAKIEGGAIVVSAKEANINAHTGTGGVLKDADAKNMGKVMYWNIHNS